MAPFNWFKRQQDTPQSAPMEVSSPDESGQPEATESSAEIGAEPAIAQDYLTWAKAAYQNIQKRQSQGESTEAVASQADVAAEPSAVPSGDETTGAEKVHQPEAEMGTEVVVPLEISEAALELPEQALDSEAAVPGGDDLATPQSGIPVTETLTESNPATLPFWAKAEAERQERLERLKAEAVTSEPEPVRVAPAAAAVETTVSEVLDEGFLWSAKILAAQGRRPEQVDVEEITWLKRLRQGLEKTRRSLINQLRAIVGQGPLNQDAVTEIESLLLQADVGVKATDFVIESLQNKLREEALPPEEAIAYLKELLREMLDRPYTSYSPTFAPDKDTLNIWLITGVNGAGKTTTIGKIAHIAQKSGYRCLIGAADTFRAAAVEQVKVWGQRSQVEVIANPGKNTDPAAVVFDAITAAQSRHTELLLIDTAGRLQNKKNLMDELSKVRRIIGKKAPDARIESLLVLDATLGQNGLRQAEVFAEVAQLTGVILTKMDSTAKGGIALAVVEQLGLPIRFIGAGEGIADLRPFSSYEFVEALLSG
jgi:fused signal recognition particle receptor